MSKTPEVPSIEGDATLAGQEDKECEFPEKDVHGDIEKARPSGSEPTPTPARPPADGFQEGGLRGWAAVAGAFLVLFATFGSCNGFGVYQNWYELHQFADESSSNISWIGSIQLFLVFAFGPVSGKLFDLGYCRHMLALGAVLQIVGVFMTSLCKKYYQAVLAQALLTGMGMGFQFLPAMSVLSHYFRKRRSLAFGLATVGSSLGGIVYPIMLNQLFNSVGFKKGVQASGYLILGCLVLANILITPRPPPRPAVAPTPPSLGAIFGSVKYDLLCLGGFFVAWGLFFPIFYLQVFAEYNGIPDSIAFYLIAILNAASVIGRTLPNFVSDKIGPFNMLLPTCVMSGILCFAMFGATNKGGAIVFALLYGFSSGAYVSVIGPAIISLSNSMGEIGIRMGLAFCIVGVAALTGTPISGALLASTNNKFYAPIIFSGVCIFLGTVSLAVARHLQARDKATWRV